MGARMPLSCYVRSTLNVGSMRDAPPVPPTAAVEPSEGLRLLGKALSARAEDVLRR